LNEDSVKQAAERYIARGWQVVPLEPGEKACKDPEWLRLVFKPSDFRDDDNIGLRSVNGLVIIDCDCPEAISAADTFLPLTGAVYGRPSKQRAKRIFLSTFEKTKAFKDHDTGETFIEIRANHQDMAPPSKHPSGELLTWDSFGEVTTVDAALLLRSVALIATATVIARNYAQPGARHDWCLALAGTLHQLGLTHPECEQLITFAARWVRDPKLDDRIIEVRTTYARSDDDPIKSAKALIAATSKSFVVNLRTIWGSSSSAFILDAKGEKILASHQENIRRALVKLKIELSYDLFAEKTLLANGQGRVPLDDAAANHERLEIERKFHFLPNKDHFFDVIQDIARENRFHPVRDYLELLVWDKTPRLDEWLIKAGRAADTPFVRAVGALVLIAATRRVLRPGCKFDELLVLESGQGMLKSSVLRALCPLDDWFSDDLPLNVDAKQIIERTRGKWIIEAADLSGMYKSQVEHLKGMLSRQIDGPVRMAYGRLSEERARQFIIIGTTNSHTYLKDVTGNRRFWPVRVDRFDVPWVRANRDQLWAEARYRENMGESIRLDPSLWRYAELQQERRRQADAWEETLGLKFEGDKEHRVTSSELWDILGVSVAQRDERGTERISNVMQRLGFRRMTMRRKIGTLDKVVKGWGRDVVSGNLALPTED
jgi:hypothetical protein